jgi:hypothetical protein
MNLSHIVVQPDHVEMTLMCRGKLTGGLSRDQWHVCRTVHTRAVQRLNHPPMETESPPHGD